MVSKDSRSEGHCLWQTRRSQQSQGRLGGHSVGWIINRVAVEGLPKWRERVLFPNSNQITEVTVPHHSLSIRRPCHVVVIAFLLPPFLSRNTRQAEYMKIANRGHTTQLYLQCNELSCVGQVHFDQGFSNVLPKLASEWAILPSFYSHANFQRSKLKDFFHA